MDNSLKRGVELTNRLGEGGAGKKLHNAFSWWQGGGIDKTTYILIAIIFAVNLYFSLPIFLKDLTPAFSSSAALNIFANGLESLNIISHEVFFRILTILSIAIAPIGFYMFARLNVLRHELTTFLAALFYILPNPIFGGGFPLVRAIISGDGAHSFAFAFIPLILISVQLFIREGLPRWGIVSAISTAIIAFISPFALFNLLVISFVIAVSEGFMSNLRKKVGRFILFTIASFVLSSFWYYPVITKIFQMSHVVFAFNKFWSIAPLLIPAIPILGIILFLIFDRREKLKPIFLSIALFLTYLFFVNASKVLQVSGLFTADRYNIEFSFASSFIISLILVFLIELLLKNYILKIKAKAKVYSSIVLFFTILVVLLFVVVERAVTARREFDLTSIMNQYNLGIGSIGREGGGLLGISISIVALIFLLLVLARFKHSFFSREK